MPYKQKDLGGRILSDEELLSILSIQINKGLVKIDEISRKFPKSFTEYCCFEEGVCFPGKPNLLHTFYCVAQLEKRFGGATVNMVTALMTYRKIDCSVRKTYGNCFIEE